MWSFFPCQIIDGHDIAIRILQKLWASHIIGKWIVMAYCLFAPWIVTYYRFFTPCFSSIATPGKLTEIRLLNVMKALLNPFAIGEKTSISLPLSQFHMPLLAGQALNLPSSAETTT
ncbi:MAG: hypothetical protein JJU28_19805 [Cyclobacteriaceae bacterium]|nr:hypothetical protein [Cyclobacteriaceae bacterium]